MKILAAIAAVACMGASAQAEWNVIYEDDFAGEAGPALKTEPLIKPAGFQHNVDWVSDDELLLDGDGRMYTDSELNTTARYNVDLGSIITDDPDITTIRWEATIRTPSISNWFGIGFSKEGENSFTSAVSDVGPWVQFRRDGSGTIRGGGGTDNASEITSFNYSGGDLVEVEFLFNIEDQTVSLWIDGNAIEFDDGAGGTTTEFPIVHTINGTAREPEIRWAQIQWTNQDDIDGGGAYISHSRISVSD